jgi:hypothetical protein
MAAVNNTANNGVISATLITNMAETINTLYDFCTDLGLNQVNTNKKGLYTMHTGATTLTTYGAEETRIYSTRYSNRVNGTGLLQTFNVPFNGVFSQAPHVTATAEVTPSSGYVFACVSAITKDGCKVHAYNPSSTKYNGSIVVNVIAIGVESANI